MENTSTIALWVLSAYRRGTHSQMRQCDMASSSAGHGPPSYSAQ
jgi:hypothetical protein